MNGLSTKGPDGREPFLAFACDDASLDLLQSVSKELGWRADACKTGGVRGAIQSLSVAASPAMLLVDLTGCPEPLSEIDSLSEVCEPGTIVLAIGAINDVTFYRELMARGIHDYLIKPLAVGQLTDALAKARTGEAGLREKAGEGDSGHVSVAIVGTRGGAGASMLATSLAWLLGKEHAKSTALLDLDVHFGSGALALDLEPGRGLTDAIEDPGRIDGLFIERAMVRAGDRLAIMSAEAPLSEALITDGSAFQRLSQEFSQIYEATVIDFPRSIMLNFPQLLTGLGTVVVVGELTLASARDAIRILSWLSTNAPSVRVIVAVNKVHPGGGELSQADFEAAIEHPISTVIAFDYTASVQAARLGQPFAQANRANKTVAPIVELAREIADPGVSDTTGTQPVVRSLLGKLDFMALFPRKGAATARAA